MRSLAVALLGENTTGSVVRNPMHSVIGLPNVLKHVLELGWAHALLPLLRCALWFSGSLVVCMLTRRASYAIDGVYFLS